MGPDETSLDLFICLLKDKMILMVEERPDDP